MDSRDKSAFRLFFRPSQFSIPHFKFHIFRKTIPHSSFRIPNFPKNHSEFLLSAQTALDARLLHFLP